MKKHIALLLTSLALLSFLLLCGCTDNMAEQDQESDDVVSKTEQQLSEKYDVKFYANEAIRSESGGWYVWLRPEGSDLVVKAEVAEDLTLGTDNYPTKKVCENLTMQAKDLMKAYAGECYVHTDNITDFCFSESADITADEYLEQNPGDRLQIGIIVPEDADMDALYQAVKAVWSGADVSTGYVNVFLIPGKLLDIEREIKRYDDMGFEPVQKMLDEGTRQFIEIGGTFPSAAEFASGFTKAGL